MADHSFVATAEPRPKGSRIGRRITALVVAAVLVSVCLVTAMFLWEEAKTGIESRRATLEATAYVFAAAIADHVATGDAPASMSVLRSIARVPDISYAAVTDVAGNVIASLGSGVLVDGQRFDAGSGIFAALAASSYPVAVDIIKAGKPVGRLTVVADVGGLRWRLLTRLVTTLFFAGLASSIGVVVANRLQQRITAPILALTEAMRRVRDTRDFSAAVPRQSNDETGQMVDAFNTMIAEINSRDKALERHRQTLEKTVGERTRDLSLARDAADAANLAKSGFLATMSHEIRTPMNGLMVMAELLAAAGLGPRHQRYADVIVKSGHSLLAIINDILDLSKIEAGKLDLELLAVNPAAIADDVASLFWEQSASKGLDLAVRVAANVPKFVSGDPVRLNQILSNLVNNALKFTEAGQVLISLQFDGRRLSYTVTDSGIGIHQHKLDHLFEAFTQADQSTTRKFGGTGLGLTICKRLTQAMGGTISVRSELGRGTSFTVAIPVSVIEGTGIREVHMPGRGRAGLAVAGLATLSSLGTALANAGYEVIQLPEGAAADGCDVVFATTGRLESLASAGPSAPALICIATLGDRRGEAAIEKGLANDLILLPLRQQDMAEMITRLVAGTLRGRSLLVRQAAVEIGGRGFAGRRVLVADDSAVNREVIIEVLRQLDVEVETAVNGVEAVEMWKRMRPDLVFMDCSMPDLDGYGATREIRAHEMLEFARQPTPIIALSANVAGLSAETWRAAGMDAYLTKPFTIKSIIACLERQFDALPPVAVPASESTEPVIDMGVVGELKSIGGSDALFRRVLDLFASRVPQAVDKVAEMARADDLTALADAAHALKSMCANIGAVRATAACNELELAARTGAAFDAATLVGAIAHEMREVMHEIEQLRAA